MHTLTSRKSLDSQNKKGSPNVPSRPPSSQGAAISSIIRASSPRSDTVLPSSESVGQEVDLSGTGSEDKEQLPIVLHKGVGLQAKLTIGAPSDVYEQEADRVAEQVMRMPDTQRVPPDTSTIDDLSLQRKCAACSEEEEMLQTKRHGSATSESLSAGNSVYSVLRSSGQPLDMQTRAFMEPRFGRDFGDVHVHDNGRADEASASVNARAFTVGSNIVFRKGEFSPNTSDGRKLLAHELTHVVQQGGGQAKTLRKKPAAIHHRTGTTNRLQREVPDPLCASYDYAAKKSEIEGLIASLKATPDVEKRLKLIQALKWILRCGSETETTEITTVLNTGLGETESTALWAEAGTAFGGYRGSYPGYYGGAKSRLKRLGVSEIEAYDAFSYTPGTHPSSRFRDKREKAATAEAPILTATDLLYFYGHQYAQYDNPGVFANGDQTRFIDLRSLAGKGDFSRVKLIVSTSCATCCKEAIETFSPIFPNAVILGYRKSAPLNGGKVRDDFDKSIRALKRPLLLDQAIDVNAIIQVWKTVMERHHPKENKRLPGYLQSGTIHYLEMGVWKSMPATDAGNSCRKKGGTIEEAAD